MSPPRPLKLALDQNFPLPLIKANRDYISDAGVHLAHLKEIDRRLTDLDDRPLIIALHQLGWDGLVTNNYKMLRVPAELAAMIKTKTVIVAVEGTGHDPLRALGALLLELPGLAHRVRANESNVFKLKYEHRQAVPAWDFLKSLAERRGVETRNLYDQVEVTDDELSTPVLA